MKRAAKKCQTPIVQVPKVQASNAHVPNVQVPHVQVPELVWSSLGSWIAADLGAGLGTRLELVWELCGLLVGVVGWILASVREAEK